MVHRALLGSLERFFGILIEHYGGRFPLWLAPEQVRLLPISDNFTHYAQEVLAELQRHRVRATLDSAADTIGAKIRRAREQAVPYMLIVGQREVDSAQVSIRKHGEGEVGTAGVADFIARVEQEIKDRQ
jgi:threonyl-tRNA synthetase